MTLSIRDVGLGIDLDLGAGVGWKEIGFGMGRHGFNITQFMI